MECQKERIADLDTGQSKHLKIWKFRALPSPCQCSTKVKSPLIHQMRAEPINDESFISSTSSDWKEIVGYNFRKSFRQHNDRRNTV
eukprot:scaffold81169_cov28-Attheya_sp.AAC.1